MSERAGYPSDISREQFEVICLKLESFRRKTKPGQYDLYDIFCGTLYVLKSACQWSMLPKDFPKYRTVYSCFRQWGAKPFAGQPSLPESLLEELTANERQASGRTESPSLLIADAQSIKNTDTAEEKGYDAGKKAAGIKRHIAVDIPGLPRAIAITTADVTDRKGGLLALSGRGDAPGTVKKLPVDGSCSGQPFAQAVTAILPDAAVEVVKRNELHTFVVLPKRWIVERSFAWLEKCRRLWKNCERLLNNSLQMVNMAFLSLLLKRL